MKLHYLLQLLLLLVLPCVARASNPPNIVILFADDISARELPVYGSSVWTPPLRGNSSDQQYRASTPVLDRLAKEGCWIKTAWASVVCSPSRAMMMTGRFAHLHKWWGNRSKGTYTSVNGRHELERDLYFRSGFIGYSANRCPGTLKQYNCLLGLLGVYGTTQSPLDLCDWRKLSHLISVSTA